MTIPQLQWELARTSDSTWSVAQGVIRASTSDNVQTLTLLACERFGATLAICPETCRKVETQVIKIQTPVTSVISFLNATVGYSAGDCASQLARSLAGIQFIALAAVLIPSYSRFDGATALAGMLHSSARDKTLLPPARHLKDILTSLEHRCVQMGFADLVLGWSQIICQQPVASSQRQKWRAGEYIPDLDGLKNLVDALRQLSRIGNALSLRIRATVCTPWVAAFIQWSIGISPSVYLDNGRSVIEQPSSRITLIACIDTRGYPALEIIIQESLNSPTELISESDYKQCGARMVAIERYGQWLLQDLELDSGLARRATIQALPYCLKHVVRFLWVSKVEEYDLSENKIKPLRGNQRPHPRFVEDKEILEMVPCPFPKDSVISAMLSRIIDSSEVAELPSLKDGLQITDLSLVELYIDHFRESCTCSHCKYSGDSSNCENDWGNYFLRTLSFIVADVLALSLFDFPETLLVPLSGCRIHIAGLYNAVFLVLEHIRNEPVICPTKEILQHALCLVGHDVETDVHLRQWVISSFRGQVVYPKIFETRCLERKGYLMINWAPGLLRYDGENYSKGVSEILTNPQLDVLDSHGSRTVDIPRNLVSGQRLVWRVSPGDNILQINMGLENSTNASRHISKEPFRVLLSLGISLLLDKCPHPSDSPLAKPNSLLKYTGPLEPFRSEDNEPHPRQINVIAVKGNDGLRMLSLTWSKTKPFVICRGACLACCVSVCQKTGYQMIVC